jgi:hypothetical protein
MVGVEVTHLVDRVVCEIVPEAVATPVCSDALLLPRVQPLVHFDQKLVEVNLRTTDGT